MIYAIDSQFNCDDGAKFARLRGFTNILQIQFLTREETALVVKIIRALIIMYVR